MNAGITEEVGKQVGAFMDIMRSQPLSLALVMMNVLLIAFLFYFNSQVLTQRSAAVDQIVAWQRGTDTLMASCVSIEVMKLVVDALERDRSLYRQMLPGHTPAPPADPQPQAQPQPSPP
jgi:chromatin segregation and condensation protein Rec8/ScpA/Scc1 (kleisin family)